MFRPLFIIASLAVLSPSPASAQQPPLSADLASRLAYFSPQRAFAMSEDAKSAETKLAALEGQRSKELSARNAKLKEMETTLVQGAPVLSETARRQREIEIERFQIDTKRFVEDAQAEFLGVQRDLENTFFVKLRPAIDALAKERGLLFVFNEDARPFAWVNPTLDITAEVVKRLNQP